VIGIVRVLMQFEEHVLFLKREKHFLFNELKVMTKEITMAENRPFDSRASRKTLN